MTLCVYEPNQQPHRKLCGMLVLRLDFRNRSTLRGMNAIQTINTYKKGYPLKICMTVKFTDKEMEGVSHGLEGVVSVATIKSEVDSSEGGTLYYEGIAIEELAAKSSFEEICFLLLYDHLPTQAEFSAFRRRLYAEQKLSTQLRKEIVNVARLGHPVKMLPALLSHLALEDDDHSIDAKNSERIAISLIAKMPMITAGIVRARERNHFIEPKAGVSIANNFLYQLTGKMPHEFPAKVMDRLMILHADHGLNASTFAARVCASTQGDMYMSIIAALCTLTGPLHGGANERVIEMLAHLDEQSAHTANIKKFVTAYVDALLKKGGRVMGIGHRVYHEGDPRARILNEYSEQICLHERCERYYIIAAEIEKQMKKKRNLWPNVDFYSAIAMDGIGIPHDIYTCIFAMGRMAGWTAHVLEQYANNRLIRPASKFVTARQRLGQKYMEIEKRK